MNNLVLISLSACLALCSCGEGIAISKARILNTLNAYDCKVNKSKEFVKPLAMTMERNVTSFQYGDHSLTNVSISLSIDKQYEPGAKYPYCHFQIKGNENNSKFIYERWSFVRQIEDNPYITVCERGTEIALAKRSKERPYSTDVWEHSVEGEIVFMNDNIENGATKTRKLFDALSDKEIKKQSCSENEIGSFSMEIQYQEQGESFLLSAKFEDYLLKAFAYTCPGSKETVALKWGQCLKDYPTLTDFNLEQSKAN